jgi:hypothetical protein
MGSLMLLMSNCCALSLQLSCMRGCYASADMWQDVDALHMRGFTYMWRFWRPLTARSCAVLQVAALAAAVPQLTCLHAAVTGTSSQLLQLGRMTQLQLLHLHGVSVSHR